MVRPSGDRVVSVARKLGWPDRTQLGSTLNGASGFSTDSADGGWLRTTYRLVS